MRVNNNCALLGHREKFHNLRAATLTEGEQLSATIQCKLFILITVQFVAIKWGEIGHRISTTTCVIPSLSVIYWIDPSQ